MRFSFGAPLGLAVLILTQAACTQSGERVIGPAGPGTCAELTREHPSLRITQPGTDPYPPIDPAQAIPRCELELAENPESPELRFRLALAYLANDEDERSFRLLTEAADSGYGSADLILGQGKVRGIFPSRSEADWQKHFDRAQQTGHALARYLRIEAKFIADRDVQLTDAEFAVVRAAAEAGSGRAWFILFMLNSDPPLTTEKIEYLYRGDDLGDLHSTSTLASLLYSGLLPRGFEDHPEAGSIYREGFDHPGRSPQIGEAIRLFEKVIDYSRPDSSRAARALERLTLVYLFAEKSEHGNPERATELYCESLPDTTRSKIKRWSKHIRIPDCQN